MFHSDLLRNKKFLIPLYLILISMLSNNILAKSQLDLESNILNPKDAFKMKIIDSDNYLSLNWEIEKNYYIYKNSIKLLHKDKLINFELIGDPIMHKDEFLGETEIFRNSLNLRLLGQKQQNQMDYEVVFQGCAEKRFCYTPIKVKLSSL
tara:strand:+ start:14819 stop:15268 length:450 start_codon:yes stop_codon:yes gene_type:complete